jgi:hypothetical protein
MASYTGIELGVRKVVPLEEDVELGVQYGYDGTELTGTLSVVCDYPDESDVRDGVSYGSGVFTGDVELPAEGNVLDGVGYGSEGTEFEGSLDADPITNILLPLEVAELEGIELVEVV